MKAKRLIILLIANITVGLLIIIPGIILYISSYNMKYIVKDGRIRFKDIGFQKKDLGIAKVDFDSINPIVRSTKGLISFMPDSSYCSFELNKKSAYFNDSMILKLNYSLINYDWSGLWMKFVADYYNAKECDFSNFKYLKFHAKAKSEAENPKRFRLELKYTPSLLMEKIIIPDNTLSPKALLAKDWQEYIIDLSKIPYLDLKVITELCIVFDKRYLLEANGDLSGSVYFDGFEFVR